MLFSEFKDLTGVDSLYEYNIANSIYMEVDEDKRKFCAKWKQYKKNNKYFLLLLKKLLYRMQVYE